MKSVIGNTRTFVEQIDQWVITGLQSGARDFASLLRQLPGIYPADVMIALRRLLIAPAVAESASVILFEAESPSFRFRDHHTASRLPIPHPLDYDWRFTAEAVNELLRDYQADLVCLGTPTVFVSAVEKFGPERVVLLDRNPAVLNCVAALSDRASVLQFDVFTDSVPAIRTNLVVADPPWYLEHMKAFLWAAAQVCRVGGRVLMSLPPHGTRPTITAELNQVSEYARQLGFVVGQLKDQCLPYETPPFELNALRAVGCNGLATPWRRGTLCVFQRVEDVMAERPCYSGPSACWLEADLYGTRFRFRRRDPDRLSFLDPTPIPLVAGNILPSVSRRHPLREQADVWTSGNRVFRCDGPCLLHQIVELLAGNSSLEEIPRLLDIPRTGWALRQVRRAAAQIEAVAAAEWNERRVVGCG